MAVMYRMKGLCLQATRQVACPSPRLLSPSAPRLTLHSAAPTWLTMALVGSLQSENTACVQALSGAHHHCGLTDCTVLLPVEALDLHATRVPQSQGFQISPGQSLMTGHLQILQGVAGSRLASRTSTYRIML